jgi:phosphate transport system ATP-binding protein
MVNKIVIENLSLQYSDGTESLRGISLNIPEKAITVLFGPAGGGKSTLLRCLNRLNDLTEVKAISGRVLIDGENVLEDVTDVIALRRKVGMVFARPVVLPLSIRGNLTYGLELAGEKRRSVLDEAVERSLKLAAIWDEVQRRLRRRSPGFGPSGCAAWTRWDSRRPSRPRSRFRRTARPTRSRTAPP